MTIRRVIINYYSHGGVKSKSQEKTDNAKVTSPHSSY
jgi:hypothetical protein